MKARTNTDLDIIDDAVDELYLMTKDKDDGVGIIRVEDGHVITEYYGSFGDIKRFPIEDNLVIVLAKDNVSRKTIRKICMKRYLVMRDEN